MRNLNDDIELFDEIFGDLFKNPPTKEEIEVRKREEEFRRQMAGENRRHFNTYTMNFPGAEKVRDDNPAVKYGIDENGKIFIKTLIVFKLIGGNSMTKREFAELDFYGKLRYMLAICGEIEKKLKKVGNEYAARDYINELMDEALDNFNIFIQDDDFVKDENFHDDVRRFVSLMNEVLEISPLIKLGSAHYSYLINMLNDIINILEERLPSNVRLARFFIMLLAYKAEFTEVMNVSEEEIDKVIGNMLAHVDEVDAIISGSKEKVNVKK